MSDVPHHSAYCAALPHTWLSAQVVVCSHTGAVTVRWEIVRQEADDDLVQLEQVEVPYGPFDDALSLGLAKALLGDGLEALGNWTDT